MLSIDYGYGWQEINRNDQLKNRKLIVFKKKIYHHSSGRELADSFNASSFGRPCFAFVRSRRFRDFGRPIMGGINAVLFSFFHHKNDTKGKKIFFKIPSFIFYFSKNSNLIPPGNGVILRVITVYWPIRIPIDCAVLGHKVIIAHRDR